MKGPLLRLGLLVLVAALLAPLLQDFIREVLILPLLYVTWLGQLLLASIPQPAIWTVFFMAGLFLAALALFPTRSPAPVTREYPSAYSGRIESWARLIKRADQERYSRWLLARELRKLAMRTLAPAEDYTLQQVRQDLADNKLELPATIQAYLLASMTSFNTFSEAKWRFWSKPHPSPLDLKPELIIQLLEDRYER